MKQQTTFSLFQPAFLFLGAAACTTPSTVVDVGDFSQARVFGETEIIFDSEDDLKPSEVRVECFEDENDRLELTNQVGILDVNEDKATDACSLVIPTQGDLIVSFEGDEDSELFVFSDTSVDVGDILADSLDMHIAGSGTLTAATVSATSLSVDVQDTDVHFDAIRADDVAATLLGTAQLTWDRALVDSMTMSPADAPAASSR